MSCLCDDQEQIRFGILGQFGRLFVLLRLLVDIWEHNVQPLPAVLAVIGHDVAGLGWVVIGPTGEQVGPAPTVHTGDDRLRSHAGPYLFLLGRPLSPRTVRGIVSESASRSVRSSRELRSWAKPQLRRRCSFTPIRFRSHGDRRYGSCRGLRSGCRPSDRIWGPQGLPIAFGPA